jgi:hypothetical protein
MFIKSRKGQSILEYAILLGVIIAALLIMQFMIKRGFQGGLKDSADKMGEQFSAGNTTASEERTLGKDQVIAEDVATTSEINKFGAQSATIRDTSAEAYSLTTRGSVGGGGVEQTATTKQDTESLKNEKTRLDDYAGDTVTDYSVDELKPEP